MGLFKKIFRKEEKIISSYVDFWKWFESNQKAFYHVIKNRERIEEDFFDKLSPKLNQLKGEIWFLCGMFDTQTAELILTADGSLANIPFVEALMAEAPEIDGWKLTCLKQPSEVSRFSIDLDGYEFNEDTMSFYSIDHADMPDEIDIVITHANVTSENKDAITTGVYLCLDNTLGEINSITTIDNVEIIHPDQAAKELIPLNQLPHFLNWRQKEFIEKYSGIRGNPNKETYQGMEGSTNDGLPIIAIINSTLLQWDHKASHPWIINIAIDYNGDSNGMPDTLTYDLLNKIEDELMLLLKNEEGYLNIGRQTADNLRNIYFAGIDFRLPALVLFDFKLKYGEQLDFKYDIYKDKYWRSFNRFQKA